jgi:hypothetical protein
MQVVSLLQVYRVHQASLFSGCVRVCVEAVNAAGLTSAAACSLPTRIAPDVLNATTFVPLRRQHGLSTCL